MSEILGGVAIIAFFLMFYVSLKDNKWKEYMKGPKKDE